MTSLPEAKNRRVLVIDDNRSIHDDFRKILCPATAMAAASDAMEQALFGGSRAAAGPVAFEVASAYQEEEGLLLVAKARAAGRPYALAFVDVRMPPGWDGMETTARIWEIDPDLQIVICTAHSDYSWNEMFEKLGQSDGLLVLKKPFDPVEALQLAHALTEKWWLRQQSRRQVAELESRVAGRTSELQAANRALHKEVAEHESAEATLRESEEKFRQLAANVADVFWITSPDLREFHYVSPAYERVWGRSAADLYVHPEQWSAAILPEERERVAAAFAQLAGGEPCANVEFSITRPDGTARRILCRGFPVRGAGGEVFRLTGTASDITERKQAEEAIRESEERFSGAFEHAPIGMALVSPAGQFLKVNRALCDLVGYTEPELLARTFQDITHPDDLAIDLGNMRRMLAGEIRSYQMEKRYFHGRGHFVTVLLNVSLVRDEQGRPRCFISQIQDITERKRTEDALRESDANFHQLADNIADAFWIRSADMRQVHYVSPAFERIWGRTVESLHANPQQWSDFILPEDRARVLAAFAALTAGAPGFEVDYRIRRPDGEIRWVRVRGFKVRDGAGRVIRHTGIVTDITEWRRATEELRESERRFGDMLRRLELVSIMLDREARITYCNDYLLRLTGWQREELMGRNWFELFVPAELREDVRGVHSALLADQPAAWHHENEIATRAGARRLIRWNNSLLRSAAGEVIGTASVGEDITERKRLEAQLFQSQKMETVGKLAGGIAHEFNSIMTVIIGHCELLLADLPAGGAAARDATAIRKAADRAAALTRQLLAYGRKQILLPEILDLNNVLTGMESMLGHLAGRNVEVRIAPSDGPKPVKADAGQIQHVIVNIVMNAVDAMPNGGKLTFETGAVCLDETYVSRFPDLKAGDYVMLAITDTGPGMNEAVKARLFEPFFTTKNVGEGTGLGLATCYGIVKQSGGHLAVYSEPGRGASFKIYLPRIDPETKVLTPPSASADLPRGTETILLVEDDPALRSMAIGLLERLGYTVLAAADGVEALNLTHRPGSGPVDLLFTDMVMPHMGGKELTDRVRSLFPRAGILFTTGYAEGGMARQGDLSPGGELLQKPFTPSMLARKVREVLDQR